MRMMFCLDVGLSFHLFLCLVELMLHSFWAPFGGLVVILTEFIRLPNKVTGFVLDQWLACGL